MFVSPDAPYGKRAELREKLKDILPPMPPPSDKSKAAKSDLPDIVITETCPDCNSPMRLQKSRFGGGSYFLGCTKYPKCKGTVKATPKLLQQIATATTAAGVPTA